MISLRLANAVFILLLATGAAAAQVEVFTLAGVPVTRVPDGARVVELDRPARLDQQLSEGLPAERAAAAAVVRERLADFKDDYGPAYTGLVRAWRLGVSKVPAVVVDGRFVVYGQPNVARALAAIRDRQAQATP